ncbi:hypothetical protein H0X10_00830 [Candidatus Saccharibacteria bacterium]|nr:hypothetical protein [Candidatus Saccharibacteria bacterium]
MNETNNQSLSIQSQLESQGYTFPSTPAASQADFDKFTTALDQSYADSISERAADRADWTRSHPRNVTSVGRRVLLGLAATATVLTPQGQEVIQAAGEIAQETAAAAVNRIDTYFNGPESQQSSEVGLPENPSDLKIVVTPEQTPNL